MTANVTVRVGGREGVVKLPNAALRYRPTKFRVPATASSKPSDAGKPSNETEVWVLKKGKAVPVSVTLGLSDGNFTEVVAGELHPGDQVITDEITKGGAATDGRLPRMRF